MDDHTLIAKARQIAEAAHQGQVDKADKPYIAHPIRVAASVEGAEAKMVGLLHDTVEDTDVTLDALREHGFPEGVVASVDAITRRPHEPREDYYQRVMQDRTALLVKIADMTDNMDASRIPNPTPKDHERMARYRKALPRLKAALERFESA